MYRGLAGYDTLRADATRISAALLKNTRYADWTLTVEIYEVPDAAAMLDVEPEERQARLRIHPAWETKTILTLRELVAHEVGHMVIYGPFEFLEKSAAKEEAEERLASRVGGLLLTHALKMGDL